MSKAMKIPFNEDRLALQSKPQIPGRSKDPSKIPLFSSDSDKSDKSNKPRATSQKFREEPDIRSPEERDRGREREGGEQKPDDRMGTGELGAIQERSGNRIRGIIQEITSAGRGLESPTVEVAIFYQEKIGEIQEELNNMVGATNQLAGEQVGEEWGPHANTLNVRLGQLNAQSNELQGAPPGVEALGDYIRNMMSFINSTVGIFAVIAIMMGGFQFLTSSGDVERTEQGRRIIQNAIIGLILIISSWAIVNFIIRDFERPRIRFGDDCI